MTFICHFFKGTQKIWSLMMPYILQFWLWKKGIWFLYCLCYYVTLRTSSLTKFWAYRLADTKGRSLPTILRSGSFALTVSSGISLPDFPPWFLTLVFKEIRFTLTQLSNIVSQFRVFELFLVFDPLCLWLVPLIWIDAGKKKFLHLFSRPSENFSSSALPVLCCCTPCTIKLFTGSKCKCLVPAIKWFADTNVYHAKHRVLSPAEIKDFLEEVE